MEKNNLLKKYRRNLNSILMASSVFLGMFSFVFSYNNIIPIVTLAIYIIIEIINIKERRRRRSANIVLLYIMIFVLYIGINMLLFYCEEYTIKRILYLIAVGLTTTIIFSHQFKIKLFIKIVLLYYAMFSIYFFFDKYGRYSASDRMTISYYMLPLFITIIIDFYINKPRNIKVMIMKPIIYLIIFYPYLLFLIKYVSRGVILALVVCIFLISIHNKTIKKKFFIITMTISVIFILMCFGVPILKEVENFLENKEIRIEVIRKSINLIEEGKFDNGRNIIYQNAIEGIIQNPILGHGIGSFNKTYGTYPHNVFLQILYEGGIIGGIVIGIFCFLGIYYILCERNVKERDKIILIYLFSISMIKLMLSQEYWFDTLFWVYIFKVVSILNKRMLLKRRNIYG